MVFITAELGPTWLGDYHVLYRMMKECKKAGFDAVKLQAFKKSDLNSRYWRIHGSVTKDNVDEINALAEQAGIEWYCMPTYPGAVKWLDEYVKRFKIRYRDRDYIELIEKCIVTGKEVIISTNNPLWYVEEPHVKLLYCINKYPTLESEVDYMRMTNFDGYSCHTKDLGGIMKACNMGIKYLEVHVTPDLNDDLVVDNNVSFDMKEIYDVIRGARSWAKE